MLTFSKVKKIGVNISIHFFRSQKSDGAKKKTFNEDLHLWLLSKEIHEQQQPSATRTDSTFCQ